MRENQQIHQLFIQFLIMYGSFYMFRYYIAETCRSYHT
jgi:hypothetical protein